MQPDHPDEEFWFEFTAANAQVLYGWGRQREALRFLETLNVGRSRNRYRFERLSASDAATIPLSGEDCRLDGFVLFEALADFHASVRGDA